MTFLVFIVDGCAGESEEDGLGECVFDRHQHFPKSISMTFINDEDQTFLSDLFNGMLVLELFLLNVAHLLNRGDDEHFFLVATSKFID